MHLRDLIFRKRAINNRPYDIRFILDNVGATIGRPFYKHEISIGVPEKQKLFDESQVRAKISDWHKKIIWRALIRNKDTTKQSTGLFLPNMLLASFAKFGVSCHSFEP